MIFDIKFVDKILPIAIAHTIFLSHNTYLEGELIELYNVEIRLSGGSCHFGSG